MIELGKPFVQLDPERSAVEDIPLVSIDDLYRESYFGLLARKAEPRFYPFYEEVPALLTPSEFVWHMGTDVALDTHLSHATELLGRAFDMQRESGRDLQFSDQEVALSLTAEIQHDWGEPLAKDVRDGRKTVDDEENERFAWKVTSRAILERDYPELCEENLRNKIDNILFGPDQWPDDESDRIRVQAAFRRAIEICGYVQSGVTFHEQTKRHFNPDSELLEIMGLGTMTCNVFLSSAWKLDSYREKVAYVDSLLTALEATSPYDQFLATLRTKGVKL